MSTLPDFQKFPYQEGKILSRDHEQLADYMKNLVLELQKNYSEIANAVNQITGEGGGGHKGTHQNGGSDEINVAGLSGELADLQKVKDHTHQAGSGQGAKIDHGLALNGLEDDDHVQYAKVLGRANEDLVQQRDIKAYQDIYVNSDYISGDEDAAIYFNASTAFVKYETTGSQGQKQFSINQRLWVWPDGNGTITENEAFGDDNHCFIGRFGGTYDFPTWTLTGWYAAINLLVQTENKINEANPTKIELAGLGSHVWSLWANSKAAAYAGDFSATRGDLCVTANYTLGLNSLVDSALDPSDPLYGSGVRAYCQNMGIVNTVRQHSAFFADGDVGWKYGFYYREGAKIITTIDKDGNINTLANIAAYDSFFVNFDYTGGDEDAFIYFNATNHYLKFNYGNDRFEMDKDLVASGVSLGGHGSRHQNGEADEISVAGLSGELVDLQPVKDHTHQAGGGGVGGKLDHGLALDGLGDDDHPQYILHSLADTENDFLVASGANTFVKKTLAETGAILETDLDHGNIQGLGDDDHSQYALIVGRASEDLTCQQDIKAHRNVYINSDYVSGDEDAILYFNGVSKYLEWNHGDNRFNLSGDFLVAGFGYFYSWLYGYYFTAPELGSTPGVGANSGTTFYRDNGSGKTQYCVVFPTGSPIVLATEA